MTDLEELAKDYADDPRILALLADLDEARAEADEAVGYAAKIMSRMVVAEEKVEAVWALHDAHGYGETCSHCDHPAPCATVRALDGA